MKIFRKREDIFNEKYNRAYRLYNNIFEINIKRILKITIIDIILRSYLNSIEKLFNVLIR